MYSRRIDYFSLSIFSFFLFFFLDFRTKRNVRSVPWLDDAYVKENVGACVRSRVIERRDAKAITSGDFASRIS